jgi:hypothetical protein
MSARISTAHRCYVRNGSLPDSSFAAAGCARDASKIIPWLRRRISQGSSRHADVSDVSCSGTKQSAAIVPSISAWHFTNAAGEQASSGCLGGCAPNNGEALMPALLAGVGTVDLPDSRIITAAMPSRRRKSK